MDAILQRARQALATGRLPKIQAREVWGGLGTGQSCDLCGEIITPRDVEVEIPVSDPGRALRFHGRCHHGWERACEQAVAARAHSDQS